MPLSLRMTVIGGMREDHVVSNTEFSQRSPRSQMEIMIIKNLITSYFNVVRKNLNDLVPKTVIAMLINKTKNQAQRELVAQIYTRDVDFKTLLIEDASTMKKRDVLQDMVKNL